ncbi:S41 family peptidase [Dysgonomonas capnocytophagoides]|uniref:S41 family peptidase n=1 Tax=Dysgonomonas capnocytophagoides TaxID=45254 RepID=UPI00333EBF28
MKNLLIILFLGFTFSSCFHEEEYENSKQGNFELLWKIIDEKYCFFEYKNIDWDEVHDRYAACITEDMPQESFFDVLGEMLAELKDGHVNLIANHNISRYWKWFEDYPDNFDEKIQKNYIGTDYSIAGGMKYKILNDNIGYIYYGSFSSGVGEANLDQILSRMAICNGIIIDVRDNGGGLISNAEKIASRFFEQKTQVGYIMYKTGKGHNSFSNPYPRYISPSSRVRYQKKVVVVTNRSCYSAANDFVNAMTYAPNVTIIGDKTGGGSGLPFSSELVNGWSVRFSSSPMLNAAKEHIEFGIDPDIKVDMTNDDMSRGLDTILETARTFLNNK